jgi:hypothetical protein
MRKTRYRLIFQRVRCEEIKQEKEENKRRVGMVIVFRLFNRYDAVSQCLQLGNLEGSIPPDLAL